MKINFVCHTDGKGLWSGIAKAVKCTALEVVGDDGDELFELQIGYHKNSWDVHRHGYIYTDEQFLKELRQELRNLGFSSLAVQSVVYSEQGMQGDGYVSLDVDSFFYAEYIGMTRK
jgi:hypothetical protein